VTQLPRETVKAILSHDSEIPAAHAWACRRKLELEYDEDGLALRLPLNGPSIDPVGEPEPYLVTGSFDDYDVLPPVWRFVDPRTGANIGSAAYPQPVGSSVLHPNGLVCAPWNRLAYAGEGGPHSDWGVPTAWKTAAPSYTRALTIPDMLDRIAREVRASRGRMAALPPLA
jgi:hypothetical protein